MKTLAKTKKMAADTRERHKAKAAKTAGKKGKKKAADVSGLGGRVPSS